jgi:trigger factor
VKVTVERASDTEATLTVELEWSELEKASDRSYRKLAQRYSVPGFRPGRAPRSMLERMVGKETLYQEGLETLVDESYHEAIRANDLTPVAEPTLDTPPLQLNQPYTFTAHVPVLAPVHVGDYTSVRVERPSVEVTDEDIQKVLLQMQQDQALWLPAERPAQVGDQIIADLKLDVGDRTISDLHDNEFVLAEGREGIFSGMDEHIVGMSEGETKEFTSTIPADYANDKLAGQEAHYIVTLKGVKYRELPEIDDELAKTAGEYQTLDELRASIRMDLSARRQANARRDFREQLLKAIVDQAQVEVHPALVKDEASTMVREMRQLLENNGVTLEQYLQMMNKTEAVYRAELEPDAAARVRRELVLDAIADAEGIEVSDEELESWLATMNAVGGGKPLQLRQLTAGQRRYVVNQLRRDKVTSRLIQEAGGDEMEAAEALHDHSEDAEADSQPMANAAAAARDGAETATAPPAPSGPAASAAPNGKAANAAQSANVAEEATEAPVVPPAADAAAGGPAESDRVPESGA